MFYEKELRKTNQKEFRVEKLICMLNGKATIFNSWIDKKDIVQNE